MVRTGGVRPRSGIVIPAEGLTAQLGTHGSAATVLLQNVAPGDSSVDKGMFPNSRKTLDG